MGPFGSEQDPDNSTRNKSSWYNDYAYFIISSNHWFVRGGTWFRGSGAGIFAFTHFTGEFRNYDSFRIVLAPTK